MPYAAPADMLVRYDARTCGQLVSDSGTAVTPSALLTDPNLAAALAGASGELDVAFQNGQLYSPLDLATIASDTTTNNGAYLADLTCMGAMLRLYGRRPLVDPRRYKEFRELWTEQIKLIADGARIFPLPAQLAASVPSVTGLGRSAWQSLNGVRQQIQARGEYYPQPSFPNNRG